MLSKSQIKNIQSLHQKKYRQIYGKFLVEGEKNVNELLRSDWKTDKIIALPTYQLPQPLPNVELLTATENELKQIATQQHPDKVVAIADIPAVGSFEPDLAKLYLVGDSINDPGNLGTMIRIADWFGIDTLLLSETSVEVYNPKVVSAAKGSLFKVKIYYTDLVRLFLNNTGLPVYGAFMNGENIYYSTLTQNGFIVMGNEANGISSEVAAKTTHRLTIPAFGGTESLNVGVATGIILSEFKRRF